jgi:hypothetical protein
MQSGIYMIDGMFSRIYELGLSFSPKRKMRVMLERSELFN